MSRPIEPPTKCLTAGCKQPANARGLCKRCYDLLRRKISAGIYADWEEVTARGLALPKAEAGVSEEELRARVEAARKERDKFAG